MKKMDNKGFSLVELIIVIAIMAILIAVLAPQYIKYVEKSRQSADLDNYQAIVNAMQVAYADIDNPPASSATVTVAAGAVTTSGMDAQFASLGVKPTDIKMKSKLFSSATITASLAADGTVQIKCTGNPTLAASLGLSH